MIKSDAQFERTKAQIEGFERAIQELESHSGMPAQAKDAVIASHRGMIAKLEAELAEYDDLRHKRVRLPRLTGPRDLGRHLVAFRIALGISQEQLAEMVGVSRQTINKHEEQEFQLASVDLMERVSEALGLMPEIIIRHRTLDVLQPA